MNIFFTDEDPVVAAQNLDDKRVIKMILESAQMLCTALRLNNAPHLAKYKSTHINHPSNIWCRETRTNYYWLLNHFKALCDEYTYRYGKIHASAQLYDNLLKGAAHIPAGKLTPFANCAARSDMNINFKSVKNPVAAYKCYLFARWSKDKNPMWSVRGRPHFINVLINFGYTIDRLNLARSANADANTVEVH